MVMKKFYTPERLQKIAMTSKDEKSRERALTKLSRLHSNTSRYSHYLEEMICFGNYEDSCEKAIDMLEATRTISGLQILREARINTNSHRIKKSITKLLAEADTYNVQKLFNEWQYLNTEIEKTKQIKSSGQGLQNKFSLYSHEDYELERLNRELTFIRQERDGCHIPALTEERRNEIKEDIKKMNRILESNLDFHYANEIELTKSRLIRHDDPKYAEELIPSGEMLIPFGKQLKVCLVRSEDEHMRIRIFDRFISAHKNWSSSLKQKILFVDYVGSAASEGFKYCGHGYRRLAKHMMNVSESCLAFDAIIDAAKYSKVRQIRNRAVKFLINDKKHAFRNLAKVASEGNFSNSIDAFIACVLMTIKEKDNAEYIFKMRTINSITRRPSRGLFYHFLPWFIEEYDGGRHASNNLAKCPKFNNTIRRKIFGLLDFMVGTYSAAKLIKWYGILASELMPLLPSFLRKETKLELQVKEAAILNDKIKNIVEDIKNSADKSESGEA